MTAPKPLTDEEKADRALSALEGMADAWAVEVNLPAMLDQMFPGVTKATLEKIDEIVRQSCIEGLFRGRTSANDEKDAAIAQAHAENAAMREKIRTIDRAKYRHPGAANHYAVHCQLIDDLVSADPTAAGKALLDELTELRAFKERMRGIQFSPTGESPQRVALSVLQSRTD